MSYITSGLLPKNLTFKDKVKLPTMSGEAQEDLKLLHTLNKETLLALCENNTYVFKLCNSDPILYNKMTSAKPIV